MSLVNVKDVKCSRRIFGLNTKCLLTLPPSLNSLFHPCKGSPCYVGIIGSVGDLQPGHLFVSQFTSYLYILLGDLAIVEEVHYVPVWCLCKEEQARVPRSWCSNPGRDAQMAHKGKDSAR